MAVVEDPSTPVVTRSAAGFTAATLTSASFSPPAGSLLVVMANLSYASAYASPPTLSIAATGVAFTQLFQAGDPIDKFNVAGCWYAYLSSAPGSIAVTLTRSAAAKAGGQLMVRVLTGAATSALLMAGNVGTASSTTGGQAVVAPSSVGSQLYMSAADDGIGGTLTPVAGTSDLDNWTDSTDSINLAVGKSTGLTSSTSAATWGWTLANAEYSILQIVEAPPAAAAPNPPAPRAVQRVTRFRSAHF